MDSTNVNWVNDLIRVMGFGLPQSPRAQATHEIVGYTSPVDMSRPVITNEYRKLGYKFMAAEAAWIMNGDNRVSTIAPYSKHIPDFSDDGVRFFGAYGPKIVDQLPHIIKTLGEDNSSRQAVINIWRESPPPSKDIPCTVSVQWLIRDGQLHCIDFMRSSDLWLGHPYDVFNFSMLSAGIACELRNKYGLDLTLGSLNLIAGSKHLYKRNWDAAEELVSNWKGGKEGQPSPTLSIERFDSYENLVEVLWDSANSERGALEPFLWDV